MKARYVGILHNSTRSQTPNTLRKTTESQAESRMLKASRRNEGQKLRGQGLGGKEETNWKPSEGERRLRGKGTKMVRLLAMIPKEGKENIGQAIGRSPKASRKTQA